MKNSKTKSRSIKSIKYNFESHLGTETRAIAKGQTLKSGGDYSYEICSVPNNISLTNLYYVDQRRFGYASDKKVYEITQNGLIGASSTKFETTPVMLKVLMDGESKIIIANQTTVQVLGGQTMKAKMPFYENTVICNDVLFTAHENRLLFSAPLDYASKNQPLEFKNFIVLDQNLGDVVGINAVNEKLVVCCQKGFATLIVKGTSADYILKEELVGEISPKEYSFVGFNDKCCFLQEEYLCVYSDGKITKTRIVPDDVEIVTMQTVASKSGDWYLACVMWGQDQRIATLCYNVRTGERFYVRPLRLASRENFAVDYFNKIVAFNSKDKQGNSAYTSKEEVVADGKLVKILSINGKGKGGVRITLLGDFGLKAFNVENTFSEQTCLLTKKLSVSVYGECKNLPLNSLIIKYQVLGE